MAIDSDARGLEYMVASQGGWPGEPEVVLEVFGDHLVLDRDALLRLVYHLTEASTRAEREADR